MNTTTLYRPINQAELDLVDGLNFQAFPERLPEQPFFYPVMNEKYAEQITRDWNVPTYGIGHVTKFEVSTEFLKKYEEQNVGDKSHNELWVPSEELNEFNENIIGKIEVVSTFTK
jgi:hypothetical protein